MGEFMNKNRRDLLKRTILLSNEIDSILERVLDQEQDCLDNIPENLQDSERSQKMENAVDCLESAIDFLDNMKESIEEALA